MDFRKQGERATLAEQMDKLQSTIHNRDKRRQQGRERRKREHSDDSGEERDPRERRPVRRTQDDTLQGPEAFKEYAPKLTLSCELCSITLNSEATKHQHLEGAAHRKAELKHKKAEEASKCQENVYGKAALAMASWAGSQSSNVTGQVPKKEVQVQKDHYGQDIKAEGLKPHCPDSGLVHKGSGYQVIQNKMSTLQRPDQLRAAALKEKPIAVTRPPVVKLEPPTGPDLGDWAPPLPTGVQHELEVALPSRLVKLVESITPARLVEESSPSSSNSMQDTSVGPRAYGSVPMVRPQTVVQQPPAPPADGEPSATNSKETAEEDAAARLLGGLLGTYASGSDSEEKGRDSDSDSEVGAAVQNQSVTTRVAAQTSRDAWGSSDEDD